MSTPRRPSAGRRPAGPATRPAARSVPRAVGARTGSRRTGRRRPWTGRLSVGRAAVLVLVLVTVVVSAALPLREFLRQRGEIDALASSNASARERVAALEAEHERLEDPAHLAAEARRRLHFVLPGETAYILLTPPPDASAADRRARTPWYTQLWGSVQEADRPEPAPPAP